MSEYDSIAMFYDALNRAYDPAARFGFLCSLPEMGKGKRTVLDACCGTGDMALLFAKAGHTVIAADISENMLAAARSKADTVGADILFLNQDITKLDLYGTLTLTVCMQDSLNHLKNEREVAGAIRRIALFTEPSGLFAFDLNTEYKQREILGENTFVLESDDCVCVWRNECSDRGDVKSSLSIFTPRPDGAYSRTDAEITERYYSDAFIEKTLKAAGFKLLRVVDGESYSDVCGETQRKLFIAEKQ